MGSLRTFLAPVVLLVCLTGSPAWADETPLSRVGRVAAADGAVALRTAGGEWADSGVNDPVAAGMSVRTGPQARAALRVGAETIALAAGSELDLTRLDTISTQLVLRRGRVSVRLSEVDPAR